MTEKKPKTKTESKKQTKAKKKKKETGTTESPFSRGHDSKPGPTFGRYRSAFNEPLD